MRPIEYRAWYHKEQKMFEVTNLRWRYPILYEDLELESFELIDRDSKNCHRVHIQDRNVDLMQYTGMEDCKGAKIFEGDIVKWKIFPEEEDPRYVRDVVTYKRGLFAFQKRLEILGTIQPTRRMEITGNIWEHPSLLGITEQTDNAQ
jgi:uncharacterized phage protein (TIGR01671 family)